MKNYKKVIKKSELSPGEGMTVQVGDLQVALFNIEGNFWALDDACVHAGGPLGAGPLDGDIVTCPWHGWQYNVKKGCAVMSEEITVKRYNVKIVDDNVFISLNPRGD